MQIYNVRRDRKRNLPETGTELGHLMSQVKDKDFVHKFTFSGDSLHYVLATKQQLYDLECFCTDSANFSVFSIDSTFDVVNFLLKILVSKTNVWSMPTDGTGEDIR